MARRFYFFRDEVAVAAAGTVTLAEIITAANKPATLYDLSVDVENSTVANSVPTPMPKIEIQRSSTAMTTPTALTAYPLHGAADSADTTVNGTNAAENFTAIAGAGARLNLNRRVPATGSLWLPQPLGREWVIEGGVASCRIRCINAGTGAIALVVSIGFCLEE